MSSIIFDAVPIDITARHDAKRSESEINGGYVFYLTAIQAILQHSRYDRFVFISRRGQDRFSYAKNSEFGAWGRDVRVIHPTEIAKIEDLDESLIVTSTENLGPLIRLRALLEAPRIATVGFLCAAHPRWFGPFLMEMALAGVTSHDALVCASIASKKVMESLMALLFSAEREAVTGLSCPVRMPLIPMAVDCEQFKPRRDGSREAFGFAAEEVVILFIGRFEMFGKADFGPLILACSRLKRRGRRVRLVLAGADHGNIADEIRQFAAGLECSDMVVVHPSPTQDEKLKLLNAADIFVSPGDGVPESFGLAPIEAMASGLPCVVADWNGYRETVTHGDNGYLVPTSWTELGPCIGAFGSNGIYPVSVLSGSTVVDIDALEHYLGLLTDNADLRRQMGLRARQRAVDEFSWSAVVKQYDDLFDEQRELARRSAPPSPQRLDIARRSSLQALFEHYPTQVLPSDAVLTLNAAGREWLRTPYPLGIALAGCELLDESLCLKMATLMTERGSMTIDALAERASQDFGTPTWLARLNVMRLIKYGILTNVGAGHDDDVTSVASAWTRGKGTSTWSNPPSRHPGRVMEEKSDG
jgi:glycosyltransferase involved in cell wall biosynthesis